MAYPHTFATLKTAVIKKLRLDATADDTAVAEWLNEAIQEVVGDNDALQASATATITASVTSYAFPTGAFSLIAVTCTPSGQTDPLRPLEVVSLEQLLERRGGATGSPVEYALTGEGTIEISPTPSEADTLTFWYTKLPAILSASGSAVPTLPNSFIKAVEYGALVQGGEFKHDPQLEWYQARYDYWQAKYRVHLRRSQGGVAQQIPLYRSRRPVHLPSQDMGDRW